MKKERLGSHPLEWIKDTRKEGSKTLEQKDSKTESQENSKPLKKATYYVSPEIIKALKHLGADEERDLSDLVSEAITDLVKKYRERKE
jgi:hypothetical protein